MSGRTIVITGASDGIGAAAARRLVLDGESVIIVGRSPDKTRRLARELGTNYFLADFMELAQVRTLAADLSGRYPHIDVLIDNAGAIMSSYKRTIDGFESTLQVNHLAPFLLTNLLLPSLERAGGTVIVTASDEAAKGRLGPDALHPALLDANDGLKFRPKDAYANSKLANVLFTHQLQRRAGGRGINAVAFHPGIVASNFASDTTTNWRWVYNTPLRRLILTSPDKAIATLLWLLDGAPGTTWIPGEFYIGRRPTTKVTVDPTTAERLWDRSAQLVGLRDPSA